MQNTKSLNPHPPSNPCSAEVHIIVHHFKVYTNAVSSERPSEIPPERTQEKDKEKAVHVQ